MNSLRSSTTHSTPNPDYAQLASDEQIAATQQALNANNIQTVVVDTAEEARQYVLSLLPEEAEVHVGASRTLDEIGLTAEIEESGRYQAIRPQLRKLDRMTQGREWRKLASSPDFMLGSVHAVTEGGKCWSHPAAGARLGRTPPEREPLSGSLGRRNWCARWRMVCGACRSTRTCWRTNACARRPGEAPA